MQNTQRPPLCACATLNFMSDALDTTAAPPQPARKLSPSELALASARERLSRYVNRSVEILTELAETAENERVRLAAVESILDRSGLGKVTTTQVEVHNQAEHEAAARAAEEVVAALNKNKNGVKTGPQVKDLDVLIVHEGEQ